MKMRELPWSPGIEVITAAQRSGLAVLLADAVALALKDALVFRERAFLVVSGGQSPVLFFEALGNQDLDWSRVDITLADERWVETSHADSNAALVQRHLLSGKAGEANWLPFLDASLDFEKGLSAAARVLGKAAWPIDVLVLGMGTDGHTASLFPSTTGLAAAMQAPNGELCVLVDPLTAPHQRISLTWPALSTASHTFLHLHGMDKQETLAQVLSDLDNCYAMPVRAFCRPGLKVYWSA